MTGNDPEDAEAAFTRVAAALAKSDDETQPPEWAVDLVTRIEELEARVAERAEQKNAWKRQLADRVEDLDEELSKIEDTHGLNHE